MANLKISDLTLLGVAPAGTDLLELVDVSDLTMGATGTNKKITVSTFLGALFSGTTDRMVRFTSATTIGDSNFSQSGTSFIPVVAGNLGSSTNKFTSAHISTSIIASTTDFDFVVNSSVRAKIKSDGAFSINEGTPVAQLHVKATATYAYPFSARLQSGNLAFEVTDFGVVKANNVVSTNQSHIFGVGAQQGIWLLKAGGNSAVATDLLCDITRNTNAGEFNLYDSAGTARVRFYAGTGVGISYVNGADNVLFSIGNNTGSARFNVRGAGSTSSTTTALFENSTSTQIFNINDTGSLVIGSGIIDTATRLKVESNNSFGAGIIINTTNTTNLGTGGVGNAAIIASSNGANVAYNVGLAVTAANAGSGNVYIMMGANTASGTWGIYGFDDVKSFHQGRFFVGVDGSATAAKFMVKAAAGAVSPARFQDSSGTDVLSVQSDSVGVMVLTSHASAALDVTSTTKGFLPPRMTTAQKNAISTPAAGLVVYDTTLNKLCVYTTAWETITSI